MTVKKIYIDTETTGTDDSKHGLIQLSGIVEIDDEEVDRIDLLIQPFPDDVIEDEALKVHGYSREEMQGFDSQLSQYIKFLRLLDDHVDQYDRQDKFHFIGYNSRFDDGFLRAWFRKNINKFYGSFFFWPAIDVANMAAVRFMATRNTFPDFKLMTVAKAAGIEIDDSKAHDAMYDVEVTRELFKYLQKEGK